MSSVYSEGSPPKSERANREKPFDIEMLFRVIHFKMLIARFCKWIIIVAILVLPSIYLHFKPEQYSPLVSTLLNVFLFVLAYWIGNKAEVEKAKKSANDRWLPQAESVILRLMTLHANVKRFNKAMQSNCGKSECDMPELKTEALRTVRVKLKADCDASADRLADIAYQLEDAIQDWRRFVTANCQGAECERIFQGLQQREERLIEEPP